MKVLHATDFSEGARQAEALAVRLARALGAELVLLHVVVETVLFGEGLTGMEAVHKLYESERRWAEDRLAARAREHAAGGVAARGVVRVGAPAEEIVRLAGEEQVDLVVVSTHGRGAVGRLLVGSVADRVVRTAPCPVVTVRVMSAEAGRSAAAR